MGRTSKALLKPDKTGKLIKFKFDGWNNILTGLGLKSRDKKMSANFQAEVMAFSDLEELYRADDIAARVVNLLPDDMIREWIDFKFEEDKELELTTDWFENMLVKQKFADAYRWARLFGGAGIVLGIDDGEDSDEPVNIKNIREIRFLTVMDRHELQARDWQDDINEPNFGLPVTYHITPRQGMGSGSVVHASRVLVFDGENVPERIRRQNQGWGDSVLVKLVNQLRNFNSSYDSAATLVQDFAQAVFKLKGLTEMIASGEDELVMKRLDLLQSSRSVCNAVIIQDDEEFERKQTPITGLPDLLDRFSKRLVASSGTPHTKILGESPSGLGASGESEKADWQDEVRAHQERIFEPALNKLFRYVFASKNGPTNGKEPEKWSYVFNPLHQPDMSKELENRKKQADIDGIYVDRGIVDANEVALSRYSGPEYSFDTVIDIKTRKLMEEMDKPEEGDDPTPDPEDERTPENDDRP